MKTRELLITLAMVVAFGCAPLAGQREPPPEPPGTSFSDPHRKAKLS